MAITPGQQILASDALTLRGLYNELLFPVLTEEAPATIQLGRPSSDTDKIAHSIKHPEALKIKRIGIFVEDIVLNPGTFYCEIWNDSGDTPNAVIANGSATIAQGSIITDEVNWFTFTTAPSLTADTKYWVVLYSSSSDDSNYYKLYGFDGKPTYGKGIWGIGTTSRYWDGSDWDWVYYPFIDIIRGCRQELYGS